MARIILKSPYLKPNRKPHLKNYVKYIATREGVEAAENPKRYLPASEKQEQLIAKLLKKYPDCRDLHENEDYLRQPTQGNADELIQRITEVHFDLLDDREKYVTYIAERPRVEKLGAHGLFTDAGVPFSLEGVAQQVAESESNVWTHIISLRREDAERLGYNSAEAWMQLLRSQRNMIAENMKINTVLPFETDLLLADPDQDLCTLVTCTPYGVNSHRLLVRGSRVAYEEAAEETPETTEEPIRSTWKENYLKGLAVGGIAALGAALLGMLILTVIKKQKRRRRDES